MRIHAGPGARAHLAQYGLRPGEVSRQFGQSLHSFFEGHVDALLAHPRCRPHAVTSRGRHRLGREGRWRTPLDYPGALLSNALSRKALGA